MPEQPTGQVPNGPGQEPAPQPQAGAGDNDQPTTANQEAARYRTERNTARAEADSLKAELQKLRDAELSETDKAKKRAAELEGQLTAAQQRLRTRALENTVLGLARDLRLVDPDVVLRLLDSDDLEWDDDQPKRASVKRAVEELVKNKPYLVESATLPPRGGAGAPTNGAGGSNPAGTFTQSQIADRKFYEANREAIMAALREGRIVDG